MPNISTIKNLLETLLNSIIALKPPKRGATVKPTLKIFIQHPIIQPLLNMEDALSHKTLISKPPELADI